MKLKGGDFLADRWGRNFFVYISENRVIRLDDCRVNSMEVWKSCGWEFVAIEASELPVRV